MGDITGPIAGGAGGGAQAIARAAIPFIIEPTGTMAANGVFTRGTALDATYASAWSYFAAGAIFAGSAAGWYYTVSSTTLAGTVFNNTYLSGTPSVPPAPTPFVVAGPGAYTGVLTAVVGPQVTIPGGAMGPNGLLEARTLWSMPNNANAKTLTISYGGGVVLNGAAASVASAQVLTTIYNRGSNASQVSMPTANLVGLGTAGANPLPGTINTAVSQTLAIGATLGVATDYLILEAYQVTVTPG